MQVMLIAESITCVKIGQNIRDGCIKQALLHFIAK